MLSSCCFVMFVCGSVQEKKETNEKVVENVLAGNGGKWSGRDESNVLIKRSKQWRSMMHKYMQVQSYLCQFGVEDLKGIAKDLGCSHSEVEGEKVGKKLVILIEHRLKDQLKLQGTTEDKIKHL